MIQDLKLGERTFRYDFNILTIAQVTLATAVVEFRYYQIQQGQPSTFQEVLRASASLWLTMTIRYLLREVINDEIQKFDQVKAENEINNLLNELSNTNENDNDNLILLTEVANDFFQHIKKDKMLLSVLTGKRLQNEIETYTTLLTTMQDFAKILTSNKKDAKPAVSAKGKSKASLKQQ